MGTGGGARGAGRNARALHHAGEPGSPGAIRHHHGHWNGGGYPDGLRGRQIPLLDRIMAVCDVHDALRSPRSHKPAWTRQAARSELRRCAGQQFDPDLVYALLPLLEAE